MCGRFTQDTSWAEVHAFMQPIALAASELPIEPAFNIAPSQPCWALRAEQDALEPVRMRWGLLPSWAKDARSGYSTFNARAESMAEKPAFRAAFRRRRCLVFASGYYEWTGEGKPVLLADLPLRVDRIFACWRLPDAPFSISQP